MIGSFVQVEPNQGKAPHFATQVKILFDDTYLYIGAFCEDSLVHIRIDAFHQKRNCLAFDTNPYGVQRDAQIFDDQLYEINWNALWKVKTSITLKGWYAEFAIPFSSIRYPKTAGSKRTIWGIKFQRIQRRLNELSGFPAFPRSIDGSQMSYEADLAGLEVPTPHSNIQITPYSLYINDRQARHDTIHHGGSIKIGLDAKWAFNTHAQVDLTINPDFAQADIDRQIINLSRSAIFLPEKRQFFLDNSGLFTVVHPGSIYRSDFVQPFYSRTIGLGS